MRSSPTGRTGERDRERYARYTSVFGVVTLGSLVAGVLGQFTGLPPNYALITESALTAVGFAVILYSPYAE